jgi:RNA polymerase sigma factor (sigma-70 family)
MTTIAVIDDEVSWRQSIEQTLHIAGFNVELYSSAEQYLDSYKEQGGCLVLDVELPGMDGLDLQEVLLQHSVQPSIVFISSSPSVPLSVRAMRAGAVDFLQKPFKDVELLARVQEAVDRDKHMRRRYTEACHVNDRIDSLTRREREVLDLVLEGMTNKEIANQLGLSHRTVELHRSRVMTKMKAQSIVELVKLTTAVHI